MQPNWAAVGDLINNIFPQGWPTSKAAMILSCQLADCSADIAASKLKASERCARVSSGVIHGLFQSDQ